LVIINLTKDSSSAMIKNYPNGRKQKQKQKLSRKKSKPNIRSKSKIDEKSATLFDFIEPKSSAATTSKCIFGRSCANNMKGCPYEH
jgi:hypothetical protein